MRKNIVSLALISGLGLGGAALISPTLASAADTVTTGAASGVADRVAHIKQALAGLVKDGSITQKQADKVARALAAQLPPRGDGPGHGRGPRAGHLSPEAVAKVLGISVAELRTAEQAGKTLAQIAAAEGINKADLISKLVAAAKAQLAADIKAGTVTQAQADEISADLTARITDRVDRVHPPRGDHGPRPAPPETTSSSTTTAPSA